MADAPSASNGINRTSTSAWTVDTLHSQLSSLLEERSAHWEEMFRHVADLQVEADRRYEQRFASQQQAMNMAMERIEKQLACMPSVVMLQDQIQKEQERTPTVVVLQERLEGLSNRLASMELRLIERVGIAFEGHSALHKAHDISHTEQHDLNATALTRAELTMKETAALHAVAHEREHTLAKEAVDKAHASDQIRFESLNEARNRSQDERATFATRDQLDDKTNALIARVDVLDKSVAGMSENKVIMQGTAVRVESLEKELAGTHGRDKGVSLVWGVIIAATGVMIGVAGVVLSIVR